MNDTEALPTKITIEIYFDARNPEEFQNSQDLLEIYLDKWNYNGKNKFVSEPVGGTSPTTDKTF